MGKFSSVENQNINFEAKGYFSVDNNLTTYEASTQAVQLSSLPGSTWGWYPGDAHLHSNMSNDNDYPEYSILDIIKMGRDRGLKWLIFTDHAQQLDFSKWGGERATPTTERYGYLDGNIDYEFAYLRGQ